MTATGEYGPLSDVVTYAGYIIGAAAAVGLAWRGRARWEPSEEDVSTGPQRVGALVGGVSIVLLWSKYQEDRSAASLRYLAVALVTLTIVALLVYSFLTSTMTYEKVQVRANTPVTVKVIGGFRLTPGARNKVHERPDLSIQDLLKGSAYDVDRVWTRPSRALAKLTFVGAYMGLTVFGTLALAAAAVILSAEVG